MSNKSPLGRGVLAVELALLTALGFCNCTEAQTTTAVGVVVPLTGDFARYGEKIRGGIGQARGANTRYIYEDEGCEPAKAVTAYKKLTSIDGVRFFLGPFCGSPQMALAPLLAAGRQLAVLGSSAPRAVFKASVGRMFSAQHSIEEESTFNAHQLYRLGARQVVIVFSENDFSREHEKAFRRAFQGEVLETLAYSGMDASVLKGLSLQIRKLNPDAIYIPDAFSFMQGILKEFKQNGVGAKKVFSVYSFQAEDVLRAVGALGEGVIYSYPAIGQEDALTYFPRLAAQILDLAVAECPSQDEACVLAALKHQNNFDEFGVLRGALGLKVIEHGQFTWYEQ